jgi:hypothetical protein
VLQTIIVTYSTVHHIGLNDKDQFFKMLMTHIKIKYLFIFFMNCTLLYLVLGIFLTVSVISNSQAFGELSYDSLVESTTDEIASFRGNEHLTKPTFGVSHNTGQIIIDKGFILNNQTFTITDNFHTPFLEQSIKLGEINSFKTTVFAPKGLKVQEFLFGIPKIGEAHLSELGIEIWYNIHGEIENIKTIQKSNVVDEDSIVATHEKVKCKSSDVEAKCNATNISLVFLEPLKDKVMALKAIDYENRYQISYLNDGFDISDTSLNPMQSVLIPSPIRGEKPLQITQTDKYSPYWMTADGRLFERNNFGSFKQVNILFERFQDSGDPLTRSHSDFGGVIDYEKEKALKIFNATSLLSKLPDSHLLDISIGERITDELKEKMIEQEKIAQDILENSSVQARYSKHSRN